jgi:SAM-dependent methyltransferase
VNVNALYWDRGIDAVPFMTGAASVMDAADMVATCGRLGLELPLRDVLDVGCGTGRLAKICNGYMGVDIAPSAVAYCRRAGVAASTITGPSDLAAVGRFGLITCLSVFTHIGREERRKYLAAFATMANRLLVDVIHGEEGGDITKWRADANGFMADLSAAGFVLDAQTQGVGLSAEHTYYLVSRP